VNETKLNETNVKLNSTSAKNSTTNITVEPEPPKRAVVPHILAREFIDITDLTPFSAPSEDETVYWIVAAISTCAIFIKRLSS